MGKVLFLAHRVPFPPDKGDKIRAFHLLHHLAARHEVWLGAGADDLADLRHEKAARAICQDVHFAPLGPIRRRANLLAGLPRGAPLSVARFRHPELARWTRRVLNQVRPDLVFVFCSAMAQYVLGRSPPARLVVDFCDADAEKWRAYAETAPPGMRSIYRREFEQLVKFEAGVLAAADAGILISETERRLMRAFLPAGAHKLHVIANGVDADYFAPAASAGEGAPLIVLCGRMDYPPNVEGARWFAQEVLPRVRARRPDATFRIVGAAPAPAVRALAGLPGVEVTGAVPDVRPHLAQAAVVVAPLRIARGIQNKVLEGMASGRPVVATPQALDGIEATVGRDVLTGADAEGFAAAVAQVLAGTAPKDLAANGRACVLRRYQWSAQLRALDDLIERVGASAEAAA